MNSAQLFSPSKFKFTEKDKPKILDGEAIINIISTPIFGSKIQNAYEMYADRKDKIIKIAINISNDLNTLFKMNKLWFKINIKSIRK